MSMRNLRNDGRSKLLTFRRPAVEEKSPERSEDGKKFVGKLVLKWKVNRRQKRAFSLFVEWIKFALEADVKIQASFVTDAGD